MKRLKAYLLFILIFSFGLLNGQKYHAKKSFIDTNITFRDTVFNFVFDSLVHDLGIVDSAIGFSKITKFFKYIGDTPIIIVNTFRNGAPTHICEFPQGTLFPNKIYKIVICLYNYGKQGKMSKELCFSLSDGRTIRITIKADYPLLNVKDD